MAQVAEACVKVLGELHMELDDHAGEVATDEPVPHADQGSAPKDGASGNAVGGEAPGQAASAAEAGGAPPASGQDAPIPKGKASASAKPAARKAGSLWGKAGRGARLAASAASEFKARGSEAQYAKERVADIFQRLQKFDQVLVALNRCDTFEECVPILFPFTPCFLCLDGLRRCAGALRW